MTHSGLAALAVSVAMALVGCNRNGGGARPLAGDGQAMFGPVSVRVQPTFTRAKDWTGDDRPDGVEALLEVRDQFEEPTRAAGKVIFELYEYRHGYPDPRGRRLVNPWAASLATVEQQQARWNRALRAYSFQLAHPGIDPDQTYVLTVSFETGGGRLFDRLILGPGE